MLEYKMEDILCSTYLTVVARDAVDYGPQVGITVTKHIKHQHVQDSAETDVLPSKYATGATW